MAFIALSCVLTCLHYILGGYSTAGVQVNTENTMVWKKDVQFEHQSWRIGVTNNKELTGQFNRKLVEWVKQHAKYSLLNEARIKREGFAWFTRSRLKSNLSTKFSLPVLKGCIGYLLTLKSIPCVIYKSYNPHWFLSLIDAAFILMKLLLSYQLLHRLLVLLFQPSIFYFSYQ